MSTFQPHTFGKYVLVDHIATGGMAEIFKAKAFSHGGFENLLVIKRILPHIGEKPDFVDMFIDEAKISVALQHPNIVRIYDFGKVSVPSTDQPPRLVEHYYIAMECVEGKDVRQLLRQLARRQVFLPDRFSAYIALEACKGLQYAHTKTDLHGKPYGVVHRDVSPSNVLVSYEGEVKVVDFGIAKAESNAVETKDGVLKGKFEYMSPEQATGEPIDGRSDVFSLGIVLYEMLTGRRLFKTESDLETLKLIRDHDVVPPSRVKADVPARLEAITLRALSRDRNARYPSAQAMADDLREVLFPVTADQVKQELQDYLCELFAEERESERERLRSRAAIAAELREQTSGEWEGNTHSTMSQRAKTAVRLVLPTVAGGGLMLMLVLAVLGGAAFATRDTWQALLVAAERPTTGGVDVQVSPAGRVLVDGVPVGEGEVVSVHDLPPGQHVIRVEADGFAPIERSVDVEVGVRVRLSEVLVAAPAPDASRDVPQRPPTGDGVVPADAEEAAEPPRVSLRSSPPGAEVFVDGASVGTAPALFEATPGVAHRVEMRLEGHQSASSELAALKAGDRRTVELTLEPAAVVGRLTVVLTGGGWGHVDVDGVRLDKTAPLRDWSLAPGTHTIRVHNEALQLDHMETVTVVSGQAVTVRAAPRE
jgi:serine/threonine protein kinase